ncbi:Group II intron reverse transcriptase/maturase [Frankia canadensis]|uniref:RNA-directed DNA polymerase n=1 Tax=Frankia canadensis TaxID=1836972 RepID=A0A2I2KXM5_9ACTN|nr:group II intron reverse transcriptase/maturase [Frankia canadensis]SNQ50406.1 Group II intron reverse transcriptase/maturase [Frankia canadensis]SOU57696.1 Group II intron reverse transcriptase/maturase [Frankia canadensis]
MDETRPAGKSFDIPKTLIWKAYLKVSGNKGAAGIDGQSLTEFEQNLRNSLFKLWNRMSSGSYFPEPVKAVSIPKSDGGTRILGVPTIADRIAQTAVAMILEPEVDPVFHPDSYGYRPGKSALDAVEVCKQRCWRRPWVVDLDIQGFFDSVPHAQIVAAVEKHTNLPWVVLYVKRWLVAPVQYPDGSCVTPVKGTPQGSAISPLLSNLFLHYAVDAWLARKFPVVWFERYCDDIILHCYSQRQASYLRSVVEKRLLEFGLRCNPDKTRIVYCKQDGRDEEHPVTSFTFLGFDFRRAPIRRRDGVLMCGFVPLVGKSALKSMARVIRQWKLGRWTSASLRDLAAMVNPIVAGWIGYYGRFYKSRLMRFLKQRINPFLVKWAMRKYKRLRRAKGRARRKLAEIASASPAIFAHWKHGASPAGSTVGAR